MTEDSVYSLAYDGSAGDVVITAYPVIKQTPRRVYYDRGTATPDRPATGTADRQELESGNGAGAYCSWGRQVFATRAEAENTIIRYRLGWSQELMDAAAELGLDLTAHLTAQPASERPSTGLVKPRPYRADIARYLSQHSGP